MKKKMVVIAHFLFWLCFPLIQTFTEWSDQFGGIPGIVKTIKNPVQLFAEQFTSFVGRTDAGRDFFDLVNVCELMARLLIYILLPIGVFYLYYGFFIPKAIQKKEIKSKLYPLLFLLVFPYLLVTLLSLFTFSVGWNYPSYLILVYSYTLFFAILGALFSVFENWYSVRFQNEKLKQQNLQSELALLKSQINPHFLFNTLNNIDALIKKNSPKASECLLELSAILRYMLYESDAELVQVSNEMQFCRNFIELQQIQYANKRLISFVVEGEPENIRIAPMLFIPFIENAFKHCTDKDKPDAISISFHISGKRIEFEATNLFDKTKIIRKDSVGGIGLHTVERRLAILYPQRHTLKMDEKDGLFHVLLIIDTNEN
jgi:hypothetical protein